MRKLGALVLALALLGGCAEDEPSTPGTVTDWNALSPSRLEVELEESERCFVTAYIGDDIVGSDNVSGGVGTITIENEEAAFVEYVRASC